VTCLEPLKVNMRHFLSGGSIGQIFLFSLDAIENDLSSSYVTQTFSHNMEPITKIKVLDESANSARIAYATELGSVQYINVLHLG
jgi:hypothetical protein